MKDSKTNIDDASVNCVAKFDTNENNIDSAQLPMLWLPKYWPKKVEKVRGNPRLLTLPDKKYISSPDFDGFYCMKSSMGCLFGAVQCISGVIISCMRLQNINTMHTMDILSMFTSYLLLCMVIYATCDPGYYCKPVVCIPLMEWETYQKLDDRLSHPKLRLYIHSFFDKKRGVDINLCSLINTDMFNDGAADLYQQKRYIALVIKHCLGIICDGSYSFEKIAVSIL
jgi:hypothetical protein